MKRVFPNREPCELEADHELFRMVYELEGTPRMPSIRAWQRGETFEYWHGDAQGDEGPHFWGFFDDAEPLMALLCHNNQIPFLRRQQRVRRFVGIAGANSGNPRLFLKELLGSGFCVAVG